MPARDLRTLGRKGNTMQPSRILVTLVAMLVLLAAVALEIDRKSHEAARKAVRSSEVATAR
jgi:hypothetical protein